MADPAILWHGPSINLTLNGNVRRGQLIRHDGTGYVAADADDGEAEFIALGQGLSGDIIQATQQAEIEDLDAPFTAGGELWTSATAGAIATAAPATGALQVIGHAVSTTKAMVNIRKSEWEQTAAAFSPRTNDGQALGTASLQWNDLFLASGGVINFNNGDTITHAANKLTLAGIATLTLPATFALGVASNVVTWTGQSIALTGANSTSNTTLTVTNSSNAAAASHSIVDVAVGGTTSTGDPQVRFTVPGGTAWYIGADNSSTGDRLMIGTGTAVGSNLILTVDPTTTGVTSLGRFVIGNDLAITLTADAANAYQALLIFGITVTLAGTTGVTNNWGLIDVREHTVAQSGGAVLVDQASTFLARPWRTTTSVTVSTSSAFRAVNGTAITGAITNYVGYYAEALTRGTSNYQILMANGGTEPTAAPADHVGFYAVDLSAGNATLGIVTETAVVTETVTSDRTLSVRINGATLKICLKV